MKKVSPCELFKAPVLPVIVINKLEDAEPLAKALKAGGITNLEVTLRTDCALDAIKLLSEKFPELCIGAGTIIDTKTFDQAVEAGAKFIISPGASIRLLEHATKSDVILVPGVATPSEILTAMEYGFNHVKFFPAEANGGAKALAAIAGPLPQVKVCPTGGVSPTNVESYIALKSVQTVGGSWMLPNDLIKNQEWDKITDLAREAVELINGLKTKYNK